MEISQIRYVLYVAEYKSFSKAAQQLSVTQPTLTQQIGKLENELGVSLFRRTTRTVSLTEVGLDFVTYASRVMESLEDLYEVMRMHKSSMNGIIHIGIMPHASHFNLAKRISAFAYRNDLMTLDINQASSGELAAELLDRKTDVAFIDLKSIDEHLHASLELTLLCQEAIGVLLSGNHRLFKADSIGIPDLRDTNIVGYECFESLAGTLGKLYLENGMLYRTMDVCYSEEELIDAVVRRNCASFVPLSVFGKLNDCSVRCIPIKPELTCDLYMATVKGYKLPHALKLFTSNIISSYRNLEVK